MFDQNFIWGVAGSAYQTEGGAADDGRGKCVWDTFAETGHIEEGQSAYPACDGYHRFREDLQLMRELGIRAYRFSLNWARILPEGTGPVNPKGIAYYREVLAACREYGITPFITLFHWEYPQALENRGGWLSPESPDWFAAYARVCAENFSDDCSVFIPMNEPQCFCGLAHQACVHAPGTRYTDEELLRMIHHVLLAQGKAVQTLREYAKQPLRIGYAPTCSVALPASEAPADIEAARKNYFGFYQGPDNWAWNVSWFSDPVLLGHYPEEGLRKFSRSLPKITDADLEMISRPIDFYGQNIYNGYPVKAGANGEPVPVPRKAGYTKTAAGWPVTPEALYWGSRFLYERYHKPIVITENGMSCHDAVSPDGRVHDPNRIDFLRSYLKELKRSAEEGTEIAGYFQWSFLDNFEWNKGYNERFGLVYVDYETEKRIPKDSAFWYGNVIRTNGEEL